jgi:hypothetical protein
MGSGVTFTPQFPTFKCISEYYIRYYIRPNILEYIQYFIHCTERVFCGPASSHVHSESQYWNISGILRRRSLRNQSSASSDHHPGIVNGIIKFNDYFRYTALFLRHIISRPSSFQTFVTHNELMSSDSLRPLLA